MAGVRDALSHDVTTDDSPSPDAWLVPRELGLQRQRVELRRRLALLGPRVLEAPDVDGVRAELQRLLADLEHHRQHLHDLVYDSVSVELGGSE
jgi:hypothetical protein